MAMTQVPVDESDVFRTQVDLAMKRCLQEKLRSSMHSRLPFNGAGTVVASLPFPIRNKIPQHALDGFAENLRHAYLKSPSVFQHGGIPSGVNLYSNTWVGTATDSSTVATESV